jgi:RNA polymerase sigma-70 factor (ECF subfamily)
LTSLARSPSPRTRTRSTDQQLVRALLRGDEGALGLLFDRHGRAAYGVALHITRDAQLAEDAVQEALLQLWRGAVRIDLERTSIVAWMILLTRRRAIDLTRHHVQGARPSPFSERAAPAAEEQALTLLESRRTRAALQSLSQEQRSVIELAYYRGLSQSETAETLGIPIGTVKSRTHSALKDLHSALSGAA